MNRQSIVAGQFYPGSKASLDMAVRGYLRAAQGKAEAPTILAMVPHAGYVFSGPVAGQTLGRADLHDTILLLGPNHTGRGAPFSVWPRGDWEVPLGICKFDPDLAKALLGSDNRLTSDADAHVYEHSLEVVIPFLMITNPKVKIVPIAVSERRFDVLSDVGKSMARVLKEHKTPVSVVVSSDMSHYVPHEAAKQMDSLALDEIVRLDPAGLFEVVRRKGISMCGVHPMVVGLTIAVEMGAQKAEVVSYSTSGPVSGDYGQVVGYAGVLVS